ncbi:four helix bundle protein [Aeromicrobium sp.]|nr:four helix bundle protein [Candidatus Saccharibacteria bacterium]
MITERAKKVKKSTIVSKPAAKSTSPVVAEAVNKVKPPIRSFRDLGTWQLAQELAVAVYRQCELFPAQEGSVLTCQMTQASVTTCASIAESFSRRGEERDRLFSNAQAALARLESYVLIASELGFMAKGQCDDLTRRVSNTHWALLKLQKINREWMER